MNTINFHKTAIAAILSLMLTLPSYAADYQYDDLNRLIKVAYNSGQIIEYSYDSAGNITSIDTNMQPKPKQNALTVSKSGTGKGSVISSPSGINCGNDCSYSYSADTRVTLTPKPITGSKFEGWRGACSGSDACQITLSSDQKVTAAFVRMASGTTVTNVASGKWTRSGSPYLIKGDIQVPKGQQLTIEPGVEVRFDGHYKFVVEGTLNAVGTPDAKVIFTRNRDTDDSRGWGIRFINSENSSQLAYCTVEYGYADNGKWDSSSDDRGAGIAIFNSSVTVEDCLIKNNKATTGAGIYIASRKPTIVRRNVIVDNVAFSHGYNACGGGGIAISSSSDEVLLENNIIARNAYSGNDRNYEGGGGISLGYGNAKVLNNTIFGNSSPKGSGIHTSRGYKGLIQNNILWGNTGSKNGEQVSVETGYTPGPVPAVTIQHNIIQSRGIVVLSRNDFQASFSGTNNISIDPRFVNTEKYDFHLQANSPAIDRGASQNAPKTDLEGYSRPNGRGYDIGAYEYGSQTNPDKDGDGVPNEQDAFPDDPAESVDTDNDGTGNNADTDDDGDGMPDDYENQYAFLNPLDSSDASADQDGDGVSNLDEYKQGTNPAVADNSDENPVTPVINEVLSAGASHTCALQKDGTATCWGNNTDGKATPPSGIFTQISAGFGHTCALKTDSTINCWGKNNQGQATPPNGRFTQTIAGNLHSCGLKTDGTVVCWSDYKYADFTPPEGNFTQMSTYSMVTCGLKTDGKVVCWGSDTRFGLLEPPEGLFTQLSVGYLHACAVKQEGKVACWGNDNSGQSTPPEGIFTQVSAGISHSCGLKTDGSIMCWGDNRYKQITSPEGIFTLISAGGNHTCGTKNDGTVSCWGTNTDGRATPPDGLQVQLPDVQDDESQLFSISGTVKGPRGNPMSDVIVTLTSDNGDSMTYTTKMEGSYEFKDLPADNYQVSASGDNLDVADHRGVTEDDGFQLQDYLAKNTTFEALQCAIADVNQDNNVNILDVVTIQRYLVYGNKLPSGDWIFLTNGNFICTSLDKTETVLRLDNLTSNQTQQDLIGIRMGDVDHSWFDKTVEKPIDTDDDGISDDVDTDDDGDGVADAKDAFPLDAKESVDTDGDGMGNNADPDDDGDGLPDDYENQYAFLNPLDSSDASADQDGDGVSNLDEYKQGTNPTVADNQDNGENPVNSLTTEVLSAGGDHTCALQAKGTITCWGYNKDGQATPPGGTFTQVSAGVYHTCALKTDKTINCWGRNHYGQATPPSGTFTQVSAGSLHTCALRTNGAIVCWGSNASGATTSPSGTFTQVSSGGGLSTCALQNNGTIVCWGENQYGQVNPPDGTFIQIGVGSLHACALKTDKTVACWGNNADREATDPSGIFTQISVSGRYNCALQTDKTISCWGDDSYGRATPPSETFIQISTGGVHACGLRTDETITCWGRNKYGQATPPDGLQVQLPDVQNDENQLFSISGTVKGPHGNPMGNVIVTLTNDNGDSMTYTTETRGSYEFKDLPAGNYQVSASGDNLEVADHRGVTEDDANRIRNHILGSVRLVDSIQCVAADVNQDNDMDVADIINIQRYLKTDPDWYVDWLFITNSNFTCRSLGKKETVLRFDNLASNQTQQDFIGIRMGDVDHSWFDKKQDSGSCQQQGKIPQVAVYARNQATGECKQFGTRCQVPSGWLTLPLGEKCESSNEKPKPIDTDGDGISDDVDTDDDGDGVADAKDAFPLDAKESVDTDGDGTGNNADTDDDGDGIADAKDAFPLDVKESVDTDGDGTGNNADTDDDGDGVADAKDAFPLDAKESVDTDGDGIGDNADTKDDRNFPPSAAFMATPGSGSESLRVVLDASDSTGDVPLTFAWKGSDGQSAVGRTTAITFAKSGQYTIELTVTDKDGQTDTASQEVELVYQGSAKLALVIDTTTVYVGQDFNVVLQVQADETQSVDGVSAYLNFDPKVLQVNSLTLASPFSEDEALEKEFDNTAGRINFMLLIMGDNPTGTFDVLTLNLKALTAVDSTEMAFNVDDDEFRQNDVTGEGESVISQQIDNLALAIESGVILKGMVDLEGREAKPHQQWVTDLRVQVTGKPQPYEVQTDENGLFALPELFEPGTYEVYVKNAHTLQNVASVTLIAGDNPAADFSTLWEGDVNDDYLLKTTDYSKLKVALNTCEGADKFNPNADLNADTCVDAKDRALLFKNIKAKKVSAMPDNTRRYRSAVRKGVTSNATGGAVMVGILPVEMNQLVVGESFDVNVALQAPETQSLDAIEVYLNFDQALLQVNSITPTDKFDTVLVNDFDNDKGEINFFAVQVAEEEPKGSFTLLTVNVTLLSKGGEKALRFNTTGARQTETTAGGESVVARDEQGNVEVDESGILEPIRTYPAANCIRDKFGNPLAGVEVQIGEKTALSDDSGCWEISSLPEGEYTAIASKDGYVFAQKACAVSDNQEACQPDFKPESLLDIKVVAQPRRPVQGEDVAYEITVTNRGSAKTTELVLTDVLPEKTRFVSSDGQCTEETNTVICTLADLEAGEETTVALVVSNTQAKPLVNQATVKAEQYPADIQVTWTSVIPYLSVSLSDSPDPVTMGGVLHYTAAVDLSHYAPSAATSIQLMMQLPRGVELKSVETDNGICDLSNRPTIICELTDLSIDNANDLSHITVEIEVVLNDLGLLLLTHEAKVVANEYPAHTDRERTKIALPNDVKVDIIFVIDVTGSMQEEINGIIKGLQQFIAKVDPSIAPNIALVTFRDEVKVEAFTVTGDLELLLGAVSKLKASGGGSCPEASAEALKVAIPHIKKGGFILFATDASPYADADIEGVTEMLLSQGIRLNVMLTGDCSEKSSWNNILTE